MLSHNFQNFGNILNTYKRTFFEIGHPAKKKVHFIQLLIEFFLYLIMNGLEEMTQEFHTLSVIVFVVRPAITQSREE